MAGAVLCATVCSSSRTRARSSTATTALSVQGTRSSRQYFVRLRVLGVPEAEMTESSRVPGVPGAEMTEYSRVSKVHHG